MNKITLKEIRFKKLKGLSNVTIKFSKPLTAIMGVNAHWSLAQSETIYPPPA